MKTRWQDWFLAALGLWLMLSPFILPYQETGGAAAWNSYIFGFALIFTAAFALYDKKTWEERVSIVYGGWLVLAPFLLAFFNEDLAATWNHIVVGIIVLLDAISAIARTPSEHPAHRPAQRGT